MKEKPLAERIVSVQRRAEFERKLVPIEIGLGLVGTALVALMLYGLVR